MPDQDLWDFQKVRIRRDYCQPILHRGRGNPDIVRRNRCPRVPQRIEDHGVPLSCLLVDRQRRDS